MNRTSLSGLFPTFLALLLLASCTEKDIINPVPQYDHLAVVVNEGPFQSGTGSITVFDRETYESTPDAFEAANGRPLGNIVQSASVYKGRIYICVNNAGKLEVAEFGTFTSTGTVGIPLPRYFTAVSEERGYVSSWNDHVYEIDLVNNVVVDSIACPIGPDRMAYAAGKLFVLNIGGFSGDNKVTVIDVDANQVQKVLTVGDNPSGVVVDADGKLWVLCAGKGWNGFPSPDDTPGSLHCIDPALAEVERDLFFDDPSIHPSRLGIDPSLSRLYILFPGGVKAMSTGAGNIGSDFLVRGPFYGMEVDPHSGNICVTDPLDYTQDGWLKIFTAGGILSDSLKAGVIPSSVVFP